MNGTRRLGPTRRGLWLTGIGSTSLVLGVAAGVLPLVEVGALLLLAVGAGLGLLAVEARALERGRLRLVRRVSPHPLAVGRPAEVRVEVTRHGTTAQRLDRLQATERAARELSGGGALRARVHRSADALTLTYPVLPARRGRWAAGPLEVRRQDPFGVAAWHGPLGGASTVAVRPSVTVLSLADGPAARDVDRAALGARTPAADDASLRDYRAGDDLRRVHWRSSARRGALVVRQDERAGRRPATVVLDLPSEDRAAEWTISAGTSIALALVGSGHRTRMRGADPAARQDRVAPDLTGSEQLLDQAVDLAVPADPGEREEWLLAAVEALGADRSDHAEGELVFAVLGPLGHRALAALAPLGGSGRAWAMVRSADGAVQQRGAAQTGVPQAGETPGRLQHSTGQHSTGQQSAGQQSAGQPSAGQQSAGQPSAGQHSTARVPSQARDDAEETFTALRRAGWTVCRVEVGEDLKVCWDRLLTSDDRHAQVGQR